MKYLLEICIDNLDAALAACDGGAGRLEVCDALSEGGLTPSAELLRAVKQKTSVPAFVMIRPRGGDFVYTEAEAEQMKKSIAELGEAGADGFVFGALKRDHSAENKQISGILSDWLSPLGDDKFQSQILHELYGVDTEINKALIATASGKPCTFHRAMDRTRDLMAAAWDIAQCGFTRILTSGGPQADPNSILRLRDLVTDFSQRLIIMPGGGIRESNLRDFVHLTQAMEYHSSAREGTGPGPWKVNTASVRAMRRILEEVSGD